LEQSLLNLRPVQEQLAAAIDEQGLLAAIEQ
jgi:hypothetical protein